MTQTLGQMRMVQGGDSCYRPRVPNMRHAAGMSVAGLGSWQRTEADMWQASSAVSR